MRTDERKLKMKEAFGLDDENPVRPLGDGSGWYVYRLGTKVLVTKRPPSGRIEKPKGTEGTGSETA